MGRYSKFESLTAASDIGLLHKISGSVVKEKIITRRLQALYPDMFGEFT
jgi:hypothetical protein